MEILCGVQRGLSLGQAIPILGPAVISPIKAVVSLVQAVASGILLVLGATFDIFFNYGRKSEFSLGAAWLTKHALANLGYSIVNMASFGIAGFCLEAYLLTHGNVTRGDVGTLVFELSDYLT